MLIEICCSSIESVENAVKGNSQRIELCEDLINDGLTPSPELLSATVAACTIPIHVLIRPRRGNFIYDKADIKATEMAIEMVKSYPIQGMVIGILNEKHQVPFDVLKEWVDQIQPLDLTFHRAFDVAENPMETLKGLMDLGFDRILTSGQEPSAVTGLELLKKLKAESEAHLTIMPGGGITDKNCSVFFKNGFKEVHLSAKNGNVLKTSKDPISDLEIIKSVVAQSKKFKLKYDS